MRTANRWCATRFSTQRCNASWRSRPIRCSTIWGSCWGSTRLPAQGASCTLQFTLAAAQPFDFDIPSATLVGTQDGVFTFALLQDLIIPAGATVGVANAVCTTPGAAANNYAVGQVSVQLNPNTLISAVTNTTVTSGGGNIETDAHLRDRIQAAPNRFSVAGPVGAYRFWALSADPGIVDVLVTTPVPGTVNVYVLMGPVVQPAASPNTSGVASSVILGKVACDRQFGFDSAADRHRQCARGDRG